MIELPVGTILPFSGEVSPDLENMGWLVCNGREVARDQYFELFSAIGTAFGSAGISVFNLPDLRGFFLRSMLGNAPSPENRDPDADSRAPLKLGGNRGNAVGSYQPYGTAPAKTPFKMTILDSNDRNADNGCGTVVAKYTSDSVTVSSYKGGDAETRPDNRYVYYIIKYCSSSGGLPVLPPVGSSLPFAGADNSKISAGWLVCDGRELIREEWPLLFSAIGTSQGSAGPTKFNLPDYRNTFLRGVDLNSGRDKNVFERTAPLPGGNDRDRVGSVEGYATALPVTAGFITKVPHIPTENGPKDVDGTVKVYFLYEAQSQDVTLTMFGGDTETRPRSVRTQWIIRNTDSDPLPVGSVIYTGMEIKNDASWLLCDGSSLAKDQHASLYAVIGDTYGADATTFHLPDYRGYFHRGAGTTTDTVVGKFEDYSTALPRNPITGTVPHYPTQTAKGHGETAHNVAGKDSNQTISTCNSGGDKETRPENVYVISYIKSTEG